MINIFRQREKYEMQRDYVYECVLDQRGDWICLRLYSRWREQVQCLGFSILIFEFFFYISNLEFLENFYRNVNQQNSEKTLMVKIFKFIKIKG